MNKKCCKIRKNDQKMIRLIVSRNSLRRLLLGNLPPRTPPYNGAAAQELPREQSYVGASLRGSENVAKVKKRPKSTEILVLFLRASGTGKFVRDNL